MNIRKLFIKSFFRILKRLFILSYFLFYHCRTLRKLSIYGLTDISIFDLKNWFRWTVDRDGKTKYFVRKYFEAELNNQKCFIKISKIQDAISKFDNISKNEIYINRYTNECNLKFVPKMLLYDALYDKNSVILVTEFKNGLNRFAMTNDEKDFETICTEFEYIHSRFKEFNIIHCDLTDANLLLDHNNHIFIIDLAVALAPGSEIYQIDFTRVGNNFMYSNGVRTYCNAFAFLKILEASGISDSFKQKECYKRIERLVGVHTYKCICDKNDGE